MPPGSSFGSIITLRGVFFDRVSFLCFNRTGIRKQYKPEGKKQHGMKKQLYTTKLHINTSKSLGVERTLSSCEFMFSTSKSAGFGGRGPRHVKLVPHQHVD